MPYAFPENPEEQAEQLAADREAFAASRSRQGCTLYMDRDILEDAADFLSTTPQWRSARPAS